MESIAWRRQRLIAESLLDEKGRRALADVRARRFAKELDERTKSGGANRADNHVRGRAINPRERSNVEFNK